MRDIKSKDLFVLNFVLW